MHQYCPPAITGDGEQLQKQEQQQHQQKEQQHQDDRNQTVKKHILCDICQWIHDSTNGGDIDTIDNHFQFQWFHGPVDGFSDGCTTDWTRMGWDNCHFTPSSRQNSLDYQENYHMISQSPSQSSNLSIPPPMIVTPPNVTLPGHIKLIDDTTGPNGSILAHLYLGRQQMAQLSPGCALYDAVHDLEWIGRELNFTANCINDNNVNNGEQ